VPSSTSAAASASAGDVPTVCRCSIGPISGCAAIAIASCPAAPISVNAGGSAASPSSVVFPRTSSSCLKSPTGTTERS
jgi:hypothetical protein